MLLPWLSRPSPLAPLDTPSDATYYADEVGGRTGEYRVRYGNSETSTSYAVGPGSSLVLYRVGPAARR